MAKLLLALELRNPRDAYVEGELIDVIVHVEAQKEVLCKALTLEMGWETHGRGNKVSGKALKETIFSGTLPTGESTYESKVQVPTLSRTTPPSYHGTFINVDWHLRAAADIPWTLDPKSMIRIYVEPRDAEGTTEEPPTWEHAEQVRLKGGLAPWLFIGCMLAIIGAFLTTKNVLVGAALMAPAAYVLTRYFREQGLRKRIGEVVFGVSPNRTLAGGSVTAMVALRPPGALDVEFASVTIRAHESATSGSGTNTTTHRHLAFEESQVVLDDERIDASDIFRKELPFSIPLDAGPTIELNDNRVIWSIEFAVTVRGGKPMKSTKEFRVGVR